MSIRISIRADFDIVFDIHLVLRFDIVLVCTLLDIVLDIHLVCLECTHHFAIDIDIRFVYHFDIGLALAFDIVFGIDMGIGLCLRDLDTDMGIVSALDMCAFWISFLISIWRPFSISFWFGAFRCVFWISFWCV